MFSLHRTGPRSRASRSPGRLGALLACAALLAILLTPTLGANPTAAPVPVRALGSPADFRGVPASPHRAAGLGAVVGTLDLATNQLFQGQDSLTPQYAPSTAVLDPVNDLVYVRGYVGDDVSVVNPSSGTDVADIAVPPSEQSYVVAPTIAVDTTSGYLYTANWNAENVSIIDGATNTVTGSIALGISAYSVLFDSANGDVYTADFDAGTVTVIDAATNHTVTTIDTGTSPAAMVLDPLSDRLFVANYATANVTVIDTATNAVVATTPVGYHPVSIALDTVHDQVDVVNEGGSYGNVTVLYGGNGTLVRSVEVGTDPEDAEFVSSLDLLDVANAASANITEIYAANGTVKGTVDTGLDPGPESLGYDATNGELYVGCYESGSIDVLDASTGGSLATVSTGTGLPGPLVADPSDARVLTFNTGLSYTEPNATVVDTGTNSAAGSIPLATVPAGLAYASATDDLYVANPAGNDTYWVAGASGTVTTSANVGPEPNVLHTPVAYDPTNGYLYAVDTSASTVDVISNAHAVVARVGVGLEPDAIAYDPTNGYVYVGSDLDGNVSVVDGATNSVVGTLSVKMYDSIQALGVDPTTNEVYVGDSTGSNVSIYGASNFTKLAVDHVGLLPDAMAFDPANDTMFVATSESGNVSILSTTTLSVAGTLPDYDVDAMLYDNTSNVLYLGTAYGYGLDAVNASTYAAISGSPLYLGAGVSAVGLALDPANQHLFVSVPDLGALEIVGAGTQYPVNFTERGLPSGTSWNVQFGGKSEGANSPLLPFSVPDGSWGFTVGVVPGYTANRTAGTVVVNGTPRTVEIGFTANSTTAPTYPISFVESGLPSGTSWTVTLVSTLNSSTTSTVGFEEPNGSYAFSIGAVSGYAASPASGSVPVAGVPARQNIAFTASHHQTAPPSVALSADPDEVSVGTQTVLTTTVSQATGPFSFDYSGLPPGCSSGNSTTIDCTPTTAGVYLVSVSVSNHSGSVGSAEGNLTVTATTPGTAPKSSGTSSSFLSSYWWLLLLLAVVIIALFVVLWWRRRKGPEPPVFEAGNAGPSSSPTPPPPVR